MRNTGQNYVLTKCRDFITFCRLAPQIQLLVKKKRTTTRKQNVTKKKKD